MNAVKVNKISLDGNEINIIGLDGLLSDINLWTNKKKDLHKGYKREVVRRNGRLFTVLTREEN